MFETSLLLAAAFAAGALNAVAGGGSLLTLPALVFTGVPPVLANATGTLALLPGYLASAWGFREDWQAPPGLTVRTLLLLSMIGGALGAGLLLLTSDAAFRHIVPWLLLLATALFGLGGHLREWASRKSPPGASPSVHSAPATPAALKATSNPGLRRWHALVGVLAVTLYGGYFNGGLGILLLALFGLLGQTQLHAMNGMKNLVSAVLTAIAVLIYIAGELVLWPQALMMMVAATLGGYSGARLARRIPTQWLRAGIVMIGLLMAGLFFWRAYGPAA